MVPRVGHLLILSKITVESSSLDYLFYSRPITARNPALFPFNINTHLIIFKLQKICQPLAWVSCTCKWILFCSIGSKCYLEKSLLDRPGDNFLSPKIGTVPIKVLCLLVKLPMTHCVAHPKKTF